MTAQNHALTGAAIGLTIGNPWLALPLAVLSHFVCDLIPHYDAPGDEAERVTSSRRFVLEMIVLGGALCFLVVLLLALNRPHHWLLACFCAFLAASPDLFWLPRFLYARRHGHDRGFSNGFLRFHKALQWKTGPKLVWVEAMWFIVFGSFLLTHL